MTDLSNLRQAENKVSIAGVLKTKNLELREKDGKRYIMGELEVETGENATQTVKVFVSELNKDGKESKAWAGMKTVMETFKSQAKDGADADVVIITGGQIGINDYKGRDGQVKSIPQISTMFINRAKNEEEVARREAKATVEMFLTSVVPEVNKDGDETGRAKVTGLVPLYKGGLAPLTLFANTGKPSEYILSNYERGDTIIAHITLVNTTEIKKVEQEVDFGEPEIKVYKNFKNEMILTGGKKYDEENPNAYNVELIKKAMVEREAKLEEIKNREDKPKASTPTAPTSKPAADTDFPF